ncbi:MAG: GLUG motif-containing protein, partial [Muribaculaceae bacterium]
LLKDVNYQKYDYTSLTNPSTGKYKYFKMEISAIQSGDVMQMSELIFTYSKCNHNWVKTDDVVPPTCSDGGYDVYECSECGSIKFFANDTKPVDHDWDETDKCTFCGVGNISKPQSGDGSESNPYEITTAAELFWYAALVNGDTSVEDVTEANPSACAKLTKDIVVNKDVLNENGELNSGTFRDWTPIRNNYSGAFDGCNHTISGLYYDRESEEYIGLFAVIYGTVKNVGVVDSYFKGYCVVGGVCGELCGSMDNCYSTSTVIGDAYVGGICGKCHRSMTNCYNSGLVDGSTCVGGVCGLNDSGTIAKCYNTGSVLGHNGEVQSTYYVGGVCGENDSGTIVDCYNTGKVSSSSEVGGVCGYNFGILMIKGNVATITDCYSTGTVSGESNVGGVCGENFQASNATADIENCYYDSEKYTGEAVGSNSDGTVINVEKKATAQFNSGEVAWLLNDGVTDGTQAWYQALSDDNGDAAPVLTATGSNTVYQIKLLSCNGVTERGVAYSNSNEDVLDEHIESGAISYDPNKKIYYKGCQEEGCDYAFDYYADAAGDIEAVPNDDATAFTVAAIELVDATSYDSQAEFTVTSLSYKRTFSDGYWQAVYVPFDINLSELPDNLEIALFDNFHEYEQTNGTNNVVLEVLSVVGGKIPALTPCLIRMKTAPESAEEMVITLADVPFRAAADNYIDCSSVMRYYKFNGILEEKSGLSTDTDFVLSLGELVKADESTVVEPQRWYLTATDRKNIGLAIALPGRISIDVVGSVSGIDGIRVDTENVAPVREGIYDLMGRRLSKEPERGFYIKNGAKILK